MKALTYLELDLDKCSRVYGTSPCTASLVMAGSNAPQAVVLDGASYLTRGAGFTSAADSNAFTLAAVVRLHSLANAQIFSSATAAGGGTLRFRLEISSSRFKFVGVNSGGTTVLDVTNSANLEIGRWYTVLCSCRLDSVLNRHLYVNDASSLTVVTYTTGQTMDFTVGDWSVGAAPDGSAPFSGDVARLWWNHGTFLALSTESNRRLFFSASNQPVDLGATGSVPTGTAPRLYLNDSDVATWHENKGTGGGMTISAGTLTGTESQVGITKCFNSLQTCQDRLAYNEIGQTLRFAVDSGYLPLDIEAVPNILSVGVSPGQISLGEDLGERMGLSVTFRDHPHPDTTPGLVDPYLADRSYNPYLRGTFWGKFRARHPFFRGKEVRLYFGELGQALSEMEERVFVGDSMSGPTSNGQFTIVAKDPLKKADGDRAMAPVVSNGFLAEAIDAEQRLVSLLPSGIGDDEYPASGYVNVGNSEICAFVRGTGSLIGNDADTLLMLHFNEGQDSTNFVDSSSFARTPTQVDGTAKQDLTIELLEGSCLLCDSVGDAIRYADSDDWAFSGTGNFTIDAWIRITSLATGRTIVAHGSGNTNNQWTFHVLSTGAIEFRHTTGGSSTIVVVSAAGEVVVDTTYHVAVVRNGTSWVIYKNGVSVATLTDSDAIQNFTSTLNVGVSSGLGNDFIGRMDELRISRVARWTTGFTPPTVPYFSSGDEMFLTRAQFNTVAEEHDDQDKVQLCLEYSALRPSVIIQDLLENYAGLDPALIPIDTWNTEVDTYLNRVFTALIANPVAVKKLIGELVMQAGLAIWWDDRNGHVALQVLRRVPPNALVIDESTFVGQSLEIRDQPDKRVSQVWTYYGQIDPVKTLDERANFRSVEVLVDLQAETDYGTPVIREIFSRWIPQFGRTIATRINQIHLSRYRDPPRALSYQLLRGSTDEPLLGSSYLVGSRFLQDDTGAEVQVPAQVTRLRPSESGYQIDAEEVTFSAEDEDLSNRVITIDGNTKNFNMRETHDTLFPPVEAGQMVTVIVAPDVIVGSDSTSLPAFDVGDWPDGVDLLIELHGRIQGRGGDGGTGGAGNSTNGGDGGTALLTTVTIDLDIADGEIWGGGGGGGGGTGGGGGGAGYDPGIGGFHNNPSNRGENGTTEAGGLGSTAGAEDGGDGGGPGLDGDDSQGATTTGGSAGNAIDGDSLVTVVDGPGDIRGPQVN